MGIVLRIYIAVGMWFYAIGKGLPIKSGLINVAVLYPHSFTGPMAHPVEVKCAYTSKRD